MSEPNLTHDEKAILAGLLRPTIAADRYPLSPRVRSLKAILDKLDPPASRAEPLPPPKPWVNSIGPGFDRMADRELALELATSPLSPKTWLTLC